MLRQHGSRIDLETHGDSTTFELVRLVEDVGPDIAGICLDTANVLCHCEDPLLAARRAAPYAHLTHTKDAVAFTTALCARHCHPAVARWTGVAPARASRQQPEPADFIEDHKWLFDFHCFDRRWLALHPDLTREEFAGFMRLVWRCQKRLLAGEYPDPDEYEKIPHVQEVEARLRGGAEYLKALIRRLGLEDRGAPAPPASLSMTRRG